MKSHDPIPMLKAIPEEGRLVRRAKAGDPEAFVALFDAYGDDLYRYIYFRVLSDVAAEGITSQVLRHAWDHLDSYRERASSFVAWLYTIARNQVIIYYKVNLRTDAFHIGSLLVAADFRLDQEAQEWSPVEAWGNHLQLLTGDIEQSRLQTTASLVMRKYLEYLNPGRVTKASPTFNAYTRAWLTRYLQLHRRVPKRSPIQEWVASTVQVWKEARPVRLPRLRPGLAPVAMRVSMTYAVLIAALLITGTARAQSALPGDLLYGWKRTTEDAWVAVSPDPVGARIILADRRLEEWLAVENDPQRGATALDEYLRTMIALNTNRDPQVSQRLEPVIEAHKKKLNQSGVTNTAFSDLLAVAVNPTLSGATTTVPTTAASTPVAVAPTTAETDNQGGSSGFGIVVTPTTQVTVVVPTATSTEVPPTATDTAVPTSTPTDVPPTATYTPVPTSTPTDVPPTATYTPVPTSTPTDVPPTDTPVPTPTVAPTNIPPTDTPVPTAVDAAALGNAQPLP